MRYDAVDRNYYDAIKPNLSKNSREHRIYPYLLKGVDINRPNFVWSTDITYIPVRQGYETVKDVKEGLSAYFPFYNNERFHQALGYRTPEEAHYN